MLKTFRRNRAGFSLVELLVVVTIIAILSVVAYTAVGGQTAKARDARRKQDLGTIQSALEIFYSQNNKYPTPIANAVPNAIGQTDALVPNFLDKVPTDPFNFNPVKQYTYVASPDGQHYYLATTLEIEKGTGDDTSYIIGNGASASSPLVIPGQDRALASGDTACSDILATGSTASCVPYRVSN